MPIPRDVLQAEIDRRLAKTRQMMAEREYDALIVYGNNKLSGSLRYLTDYFPDRAGWISLTPTETAIVDGGAVFITQKDDPALMVDPGLMPTREVCVPRIVAGEGFSAKKGDGLSVENLEMLILDAGNVRRVGIETFDKFPAPLYAGMRETFPNLEIVRSTIVEELRMVKSDFDLEMMRKAGRVADLGHETVADILGTDGVGTTELELIRAAEHAMRSADPIYEDSCSSSPSLICSGYPVAGALLHMPSPAKAIERGNVVHWDICMRFEGYPVDSSRTRAMGQVTDTHRRAYEAILEIQRTVIEKAKPGILAGRLVDMAEAMARDAGFDLWDRFLGHGLDGTSTSARTWESRSCRSRRTWCSRWSRESPSTTPICSATKIWCTSRKKAASPLRPSRGSRSRYSAEPGEDFRARIEANAATACVAD